MDAVGIGALNVDLFYRVSDLELNGRRFEPGGETFGTEKDLSQVLNELNRSGVLEGQSGGGSAANTMYALGRMGFGVGFLGVVGKDAYGRFILGSMSGVDVDHVKKFQKTGMCVSLLTEEDRSLLVLPNANDYFAFTEEDIEYLNSARIVHLTSFVGDNSFNSQKRLMEYLDPDVMVSFGPGELYARRGLKAISPLLSRSRVVFLNDREVKLLTGLEPREGSRELLERGPQIVACTLGERGSMITTEHEELTIPIKRTKMVDKTGAGDVYAAGFLAGMLNDWSMEKCGRLAATASAFSIAAYGREGYPDIKFMRSFIKEVS